jgi:hypothetical protein
MPEREFRMSKITDPGTGLSSEVIAIQEVSGQQFVDVVDEKVEIYRGKCGRSVCGLIVNVDKCPYDASSGFSRFDDEDTATEVAVDITTVCAKNDCSGEQVTALSAHLETLPDRANTAIADYLRKERQVRVEAAERVGETMRPAREQAAIIQADADVKKRDVLGPAEEAAAAIGAQAALDVQAAQREIYSEALSHDMPPLPPSL